MTDPPSLKEPDGCADESADAATCHCVFDHAITNEQRAKVSKEIDYARGIGDLHGLAIHLIRLLGDCPARRST